MPLLNNKNHYGLVTIILHWLIAITTIALFILGLWMVSLGYYDAWYIKGPKLHEGIGVLLLFALLFRISWRLYSPQPSPLASHSQLERNGARAVHVLLNGLLFLVIISGYLIVTAKGKPLSVFDWFDIPASVTGIDNLEDISGKVHYYLACIIIFLASIHAIAALKHHFIDKDDTLKRMLKLKSEH